MEEKKENLVSDKSFAFAIRVVKLYQFLQTKKEYVLSKQLLRCGTSVGANVREAINAESKPDFMHKLGIAQKEIGETMYWLDLLFATGFLNEQEYKSINKDAVEIIKIIKRIIISTKKTLSKKGINNH